MYCLVDARLTSHGKLSVGFL